jgi:hypothetical protein
MSDDVQRNYLNEAMAIIGGQSRIIAEADHLRALAAQQESILREHRLLAEVLAAILIDVNQPSIVLAAADLTQRQDKILDVRITQNHKEKGAVLVDLCRRPMAAQADASRRRVN